VSNPYLEMLQAEPAPAAAANPYLDMLQTRTPDASPAAAENPYLSDLQAEHDRQRQALAGSLSQAVAVNPDQFATKRKVAGAVLMGPPAKD